MLTLLRRARQHRDYGTKYGPHMIPTSSSLETTASFDSLSEVYEILSHLRQLLRSMPYQGGVNLSQSRKVLGIPLLDDLKWGPQFYVRVLDVPFEAALTRSKVL
jgi:hypothetical protein